MNQRSSRQCSDWSVAVPIRRPAPAATHSAPQHEQRGELVAEVGKRQSRHDQRLPAAGQRLASSPSASSSGETSRPTVRDEEPDDHGHGPADGGGGHQASDR